MISDVCSFIGFLSVSYRFLFRFLLLVPYLGYLFGFLIQVPYSDFLLGTIHKRFRLNCCVFWTHSLPLLPQLSFENCPKFPFLLTPFLPLKSDVVMDGPLRYIINLGSLFMFSQSKFLIQVSYLGFSSSLSGFLNWFPYFP